MVVLPRCPRSALDILRSATGSYAIWVAPYPSASEFGLRHRARARLHHGDGDGLPSSVKMCVMPSFRAMMPVAIGLVLQLDLDVDAGRKVEAHERVDRLRRGLMDVDQTLVRADLEMLAASLSLNGPRITQ